MTAVAKIQARLPMPDGIEEIDVRKWRVLCESVFPSAKTPEAIVMAIDYCRARNLDIFKRPVNIVPMYNKTLKREVETIWPGINEVQTTAARTGQYAGMDEPKWGPEVEREFTGVVKWKDDGAWKEESVSLKLAFPQWCSVTVYRMIEGQRCPFTEPVYWLEAYARRGKTEVPNDMWAKRPRGQIMKVAKAFSLRAAFPEEGEYVAEEMEGKEIEAGGVVIEGEVKPPAFKNAALRNAFSAKVIDSIESSQTTDELATLQTENQAKLDEMRASGNEYDLLAVEELAQRFKRQWNRLVTERKEDGEEQYEADQAAGLRSRA